jgi:hypothetical protein
MIPVGFQVLVAAIALGGILGGIANAIISHVPGTKAAPVRAMFLGLVAASLVPLFLNIAKSSLVGDILAMTDAWNKMGDVVIFFGVCVLAALSARPFMDQLSKKVLQIAETAQATAETAQREAVAARATAAQAAETNDLLAETVENLDAGRPFDARPESIAPDISKLPLGGDEKKVLRALLGGRFEKRTVAGLARETGLGADTVRAALGDLGRAGYVAETRSARTGTTFYAAQSDTLPN